jgi:murein DD-endopeptidase MepM/ murein hydrolase activator NlpD
MHAQPPLLDVLRSRRANFAPVVRTDGNAIVFDLSTGARVHGRDLAGLDVTAQTRLIEGEMSAAGTAFAFGRYGEPRSLYNNEHFIDAETGEARTIHLGIDLFCVPGTAVHAPLDAAVEFVAHNDMALGYGPMLVLRHRLAACEFFTLYGHLGVDTFARVAAGQSVAAGEQIAVVGSPPGNGNWPPHLHMQLITDLAGLGSDFPGVAAVSQRERWFALSPSPAVFFPEIGAEQLEYS